MTQDQKPEVRPLQQTITSVPTATVSVVETPEFQAALKAAVAAALKNQTSQETPVANQTKVLNALVEHMHAERTKEEKAEQEKFAAIDRRNRQHARNSQSSEADTRNKQRYCRHVKGGKLQKPGFRDYNVYLHTFTDGERVIKCNGCSMRWRPRDTKEFLYRGVTINGQSVIHKYRNHSGIGWHEAFLMLQASTNTESRSEVVMQATPSAQQPAIYSQALLAQQANEIETYGTPVVESPASEQVVVKAAEDDVYAKPVVD